jgi:asparagine N-glycosylation enzyme membrane subunit Stt3
VAGIAIFLVVFFPNIGKAKTVASQPFLIDQAWYSSLEWLKDNSPEPFGTPDFYYEQYETPFHYPESAYGIMSWWDYGYWIMYISHRIPNCHPGGGNRAQVASFFVAQDENSADKIMNKLGSKYVIIDYLMPTTKFYAMPEWAGKDADDFFEIYYVPDEEGKLQPARLFYPAYYSSILARLYNFDGKAVVPQKALVISYEEELTSEGVRYKKVTSALSFSTYEQASDYISGQESRNYRIVSTDEFASPVPLPELEHYKLVHASSETWEGKPSVKIFEYDG